MPATTAAQKPLDSFVTTGEILRQPEIWRGVFRASGGLRTGDAGLVEGRARTTKSGSAAQGVLHSSAIAWRAI